MNIHVEIAESCSGKLLVKKPIKDITVMGFLCEFDIHESRALVDDQGRYKSFDAKIIPTEASPEYHLPTACNLHSVRRVSAESSVVSFRYKAPIRQVQQTLDELFHAARLALKEKNTQSGLAKVASKRGTSQKSASKQARNKKVSRNQASEIGSLLKDPNCGTVLVSKSNSVPADNRQSGYESGLDSRRRKKAI
jgi:hypothetical protein